MPPLTPYSSVNEPNGNVNSAEVDIYVLPPIASSSLLSFDVNLGLIPLGAKPLKVVPGSRKASEINTSLSSNPKMCPIFSDKEPTILLVKSL